MRSCVINSKVASSYFFTYLIPNVVNNKPQEKGEKTMGKVIVVSILSCLLLVEYCSARVYKYVIFNIECGGHMKRAADANTVEMATQEMETVMAYLERGGMTRGYTSVLYRTPDEDVGFWYQNMKASLAELKSVKSDATSLEKSNILMKLRETLLDEDRCTGVTVPAGISVYPHNTAYTFFGIFSLVMLIIGRVVAGVKREDWR